MYKYKFALNILIESFVIIISYVEGNLIFLLLFFISLIYYCFLFIIVFDTMYMLLPLYVICSKIEIKKF